MPEQEVSVARIRLGVFHVSSDPSTLTISRCASPRRSFKSIEPGQVNGL